MRVKLREIAEAAQHDPKKALLDAVAPLVDFELFHNVVLVATYIRPEKTAGGIIRPDRNLLEDRYQGKVGLVIGTGPLAFVDDNLSKFGGKTLGRGDWVVYRPSDGVELFYGDGRDGISCRLLEDTHIKGRIADPSIIY